MAQTRLQYVAEPMLDESYGASRSTYRIKNQVHTT